MNELKTAPALPGGGTTTKPGKDGPMAWDRLIALFLAIGALFFVTRSCPFSAGTYWDLLYARDFDLDIGWTMLPERLALLVVQSPASLMGLKAVSHLLFMGLLCLFSVWVFRSRDILPGLILVSLLAFALQPLLSLRSLLQGLFLTGLMAAFDLQFFRGKFGVALIPVTAAASALGLNSWLLVLLVVAQVFLSEDHRLSLILCALTGILLFPEGAASAVTLPPPLSARFPSPDELRMLSLLAGILLVPNLWYLKRTSEENFAHLFFYALTGLLALASPEQLSLFVIVGAVLLLGLLADWAPLSSNGRIAGIALLTMVLHLFLFLTPFGFHLNTKVRGELGESLSPLILGSTRNLAVRVQEIGELAWKGLIQLRPDDLPGLPRSGLLLVSPGKSGLELQPFEAKVEPDATPDS